MLKRLIPGCLMVAVLAACTVLYPSAKHYFVAVQAFTAAERGDPDATPNRIEAAIETRTEDLGNKINASRDAIQTSIATAVLIGQAERAHIFNTYVTGTEALRLEVQKLRGEVSALNERAVAQKAPKAEEPKKPARKAPQGPQQPSGLFSFFPTSWEPTISWEATVVDHRPRRQ